MTLNYPIVDTSFERVLPSESWVLEHHWTTTPDRRRYALSVTLAGIVVFHDWELVALDDVEAANVRYEREENVTGPGWYLEIPKHDLQSHVITPKTLPKTSLLSFLVDEYRAKLEALNAVPLPDHHGRRPRLRRLFPTDHEPTRWVEAADCLNGVLIDPVLPPRADEGPLGLMPEELELWICRPYIISTTLVEKIDLYHHIKLEYESTEDLAAREEAWAHQESLMYPNGVSFKVEYLDWGVLDRPQEWGEFATLDEALDCARFGPWRCEKIVEL